MTGNDTSRFLSDKEIASHISCWSQRQKNRCTDAFTKTQEERKKNDHQVTQLSSEKIQPIPPVWGKTYKKRTSETDTSSLFSARAFNNHLSED